MFEDKNKLEEHIFYENENIKITSTLVEYEDIIIPTKSISSVEIDKEEVEPPTGYFGFGALGIIYGGLADHDGSLLVGIILIIIGLSNLGFKKLTLVKSIIISVESGDKYFIDDDHIEDEDMKKILHYIKNAIIFRG